MSAVSAFPLDRVRLLDGPLKNRQELNRRYLLELDPERLLHNFRSNAGLPSTAVPLGGWEAPTCGLRGHFVGHYLSACAALSLSVGDAALRARGNTLVAELAKCQAALGGGYLSAFPASDFDILEEKCEGAWASYYTYHKIMAGLLDMYRLAGNAQALTMVRAMAGYAYRRLTRLSPERLEKLLDTTRPNPTNESGGMSEVLHNLFAETGDPENLRLAQLFDRAWFLDPLAAGHDCLDGLHSNTHIPLVLGALRDHELTGNSRYLRAAKYFWERTALARSYANGGSSGPRPDGLEKSTGGEHWPRAGVLAGTLTPKICESCVTHNMRRLTAALFRHEPAARYAAFLERTLLNSVLCMQHPGYPGGYIYGHPLGSGSRKEFGHADDTFWCCYGTSIEAFARLAETVYFHTHDGLWITSPVASELVWPESGLRLEQRTRFPAEPVTRLIFHQAPATPLTLHLPVPAWVGADVGCRLNGRALPLPAAPGSFCAIKRRWRAGDILELTLPFTLRSEPMPDDPGLVALFSGPVLLAARSDGDLRLSGDPAKLSACVRPVPGEPLAFRLALPAGDELPLVPLHQIVDEVFGVYFRVTPSP